MSWSWEVGVKNEQMIIMSIRRQYLNRILTGEKKIEVRRKFSRGLDGVCVAVYVPKEKVIGDILLTEIAGDGDPLEMWEAHHEEVGIEWEEYEKYTRGAKRVWMIKVKSCRMWYQDIPFSWIGENARPPQSYRYMTWDESDRLNDALTDPEWALQYFCPALIRPFDSELRESMNET